MSWAAAEFKEIDLGDRRLDKRAVLIAERLAVNPMASIAQACGGWAETQAAYRFLAQDDIGWQSILEPHWQSTEIRLRTQPVVLCIQDTTELDFNGQGITGLGLLSYEAQRGMYVHPTYAVMPEGGKLWAAMIAGEAVGGLRFTLASRPGKPAREVRQRVWAKRVELRDGAGGRVGATCLVAREEQANPRAGAR